MAQVNLGHVVGPGVPTGGTANQVLVKNGSSNFDTSWKDAGTIPAIANVQDGLAIVANGNTHAAIASGQFVYVKNHGSLAEGLYKATEAIGTNATLSTSNLAADGAGGLNALKADVDTLNSNLANKAGIGTGSTDIPVHTGVMINNTGSSSDVIEMGGGTSGAAPGNNVGGILYDHSSHRFRFRQKNNAGTNYDDFQLPGSASVSSNSSYVILTSKDLPFVREAGASPGGSSNSITFNAPTDGRHAILCYAANMSHIFSVNNTDSTVFVDGIADGFTLTKSSGTYTLMRSSATVFNYVILWI